MEREIKYYRTSSGRTPVKSFIDGLNERQQEKVYFVFLLVKTIKVVPKHFLKKLKNCGGIWEIRVEFKNDLFRFLGFFDGNKLIVLSHAFTKKSQKIHKKEINIAKARMEDYYEK